MRKRLSPPQVLIFGFVSFILVGTLLLLLPMSTPEGISFVDALFTSTSAVCVTGLIVKDTPLDFTVFGQIVILCLVQIGGFGYMTSATILFLLLGKRIGISERLVMKDALNVASLEGIVRFTKAVVLMTLIFEGVGALLLAVRFLRFSPPGKALFDGVFLAVSAFNNAGFSVFSDNLVGFRGDAMVTLVITSLIIAGGVGFIAVSDVHSFLRRRSPRVSVHTKTVFLTTTVLIVLAASLIYAFERSNPLTLSEMPAREQILASYFAAVTPRTAGFNTVDYAKLSPDTLVFTMLLMFIGASPGSTGGGVKTTTVAIVLAGFWATLRNTRDATLFRRRIPAAVLSRSLMLIVFSLSLILLFSLLIMRAERVSILPAAFEVTSAFATVGLSLGDGGVRSLSAGFGPLGKMLICAVMFIGRLGPLTLAIAVIRSREERYRYPEGRILIG
ncbi:MAG: TrkH family potassium uptake protein [Thermodesulfovibrionales bacterium]